MATYLCVKAGNQTKSYAVKSSANKPYMRVSTGYLQLTTETTTDTGMRIKDGSSAYRVVESYTTTTSAATTYESQYQTTRESAYQTTRQSGYNTTSSAAMANSVVSNTSTTYYYQKYGSTATISETHNYVFHGVMSFSKRGSSLSVTRHLYIGGEDFGSLSRGSKYISLSIFPSLIATLYSNNKLSISQSFAKKDFLNSLGVSGSARNRSATDTSSYLIMSGETSQTKSTTTGAAFILDKFDIIQGDYGFYSIDKNTTWQNYYGKTDTTQTASQTGVSRTTSQYLSAVTRSYYSMSKTATLFYGSNTTYHTRVLTPAVDYQMDIDEGNDYTFFTATINASKASTMFIQEDRAGVLQLMEEHAYTRYSSSTLSYATTRASNYNTTRESAYQTTREGQTTTTSQITVDG